ncbi:MAG: hypothetical protein V4615_03875 [Bacteroidota bacterium]
MHKKYFLFLFSISFAELLFSQNTAYIQEKFCKNLHKVFELGRQDNFESYDGTMVKQSPFLQVPGYSIKLDEFAVNYADKDHRFVAKTNVSMDSLSALQELERLKPIIGFCLDSVQWSKWAGASGDDSTTLFFKELKVVKTQTKDLELKLAVVIAAAKVYTVNMYVKRRR